MSLALSMRQIFDPKHMQQLTEELAVLFDSALNGILVVNGEGITVYANPAYARITRTEVSSRLGTNILVLDPDCPLSKTLRTGQALKNYKFKLCDGDNELISNTSPICYEGQVLGAISIFQDVQAIVCLTEELKKQQQTIDVLKNRLNTVSTAKYRFESMIGNSQALLQAIQNSKDVAGTDATVLITGESGVGKELFAHSIHNSSQRRSQPFIRVNCAAIPENLIESEFFGYEKGAFTGAGQKKIGMFELANQGTIFLDEIGEMNTAMQAKLLRVLEEREFYRIGGRKPIHLDIRVIAATNRNLKKAITEGKFREDLYYRINIFNVDVPPLRDRGEDVLLLAQFFLEKNAKKIDKSVIGITEVGKEILVQYSWPGNIRELRNIIERAVIVCKGELLSEDELGFLCSTPQKQERNSQLLSMRELEKRAIQKGLELYGDICVPLHLLFETTSLYHRNEHFSCNIRIVFVQFNHVLYCFTFKTLYFHPAFRRRFDCF